MTRAEHLAWCKQRALELLVDTGNPQQAFQSMASDLRKHPETINHSGPQLGMALLVGGHLSTAAAMRDHLEGYQ